MKTEVFNATGKKIKDIELDPSVFEVKENMALVHQVIKSELANKRQGDASTKTRGKVRGGGVKPHRQKGTGRARAGTIRSPLWKGGGTVFGPQPKDYNHKIPKKMKRLAVKGILSSKAKNSEIIVIDKFGLTEPKTKKAQDILTKIKAPKRVTIIIQRDDELVKKSIQNIAKADVILDTEITAYELLNNEALVITEPALNAVTEVLKG